jgi:hypothetical protein
MLRYMVGCVGSVSAMQPESASSAMMATIARVITRIPPNWPAALLHTNHG